MLGLPAEIIFCTKRKVPVRAFDIAVLAVPKVNEILALKGSHKSVRNSHDDYIDFDCVKVVDVRQEIDLEGDPEPGKQIGPPCSKLLISVVPAQSSAYKKAIAKAKKAKKPKSKKK